MIDKRIAYIGIALVLVIVGGAIAVRWWRETPPAPAAPIVEDADSDAHSPPVPLWAPAFEEVELGVLARGVPPDRAVLEGRIVPALCGDEAACAAVKATLRDPDATVLESRSASSWMPASVDAGRGLGGDASDGERLVTVVRVRTATSPRHLAWRTAVAVATALAGDDGRVVDALIGRAEGGRSFAAGAAVTGPLGAPLFRPDRVRILSTAVADQVVRLRTVGLARWGAPDVELAAIPESARDPATKLVLAVAAALCQGSPTSPVTLLASLAADSGIPGGGAEDADRVDVVLASVPQEPGTPGGFLARIEPAGGEGPVAALELVERVVGPATAAPPDEGAARARASSAQRELAQLLEAQDRGGAPDAADLDAAGTAVLVRLPFAIPGGGVESLWVRVSRHDAATVTGRIEDDPLAATDVSRGDRVTRPRSDVQAVRLR